MRRKWTALGMAALAATLALGPRSAAADGFALSHAPVANDPTLTHRPSAKLWPHINITEARRLWGQPGVVFVDARSHLEWKQSRIPGAVSLPGLEFQNRFPPLRKRFIHARVVVLYCHGFSCGGGDYVANLLAEQGLRNMAVFSGGFPQWRAEGLPLERPGFKKKASSDAPSGGG